MEQFALLERMIVMWAISEAQRKGFRAEERAAEYLRALGYRIAARNWKARRGELDIVAWDGEELVFVEVRARSRRDFGIAEETVGWAKRLRVRRAAEAYLLGQPQVARTRFDVIALDALGLRHHRDAF